MTRALAGHGLDFRPAKAKVSEITIGELGEFAHRSAITAPLLDLLGDEFECNREFPFRLCEAAFTASAAAQYKSIWSLD